MAEAPIGGIGNKKSATERFRRTFLWIGQGYQKM